MKPKSIIAVFIIIAIACQCNSKYNDCDNYNLGDCFSNCNQIPKQYTDSIITKRTEYVMMKIKNENDFQNYLNLYPIISKRFLQIEKSSPKAKILAKKLIKLTKDPYFDTLYQEVKKYYPNLNQHRKELAYAFHRLKKIDNQWTNPTIVTTITGFVGGCDIAYQDNKILIGLDWFMDINAKYRAPDQPTYILNRMTPKHLPIAVLLMISDMYNKTNTNDKTLVADMLTYGKAYEFIHQLLPCKPDSLILGYTPKEMADVNHNQTVIWKHFLDNKLLFSVRQKDKRDYVFEAPHVQAIDLKCPGRIGRWLGWEIIKAYIKNNNVSLKELLNETDYQKIFSKSGYRPKESR